MNEYNIAIVVKLIYTHGCSIDIIQKEFYCEYCYSNELAADLNRRNVQIFGETWGKV